MHVSAGFSAAVALALVSTAVVARARVKRVYERRTLARLPLGPSGIIRGAEAIDLRAPAGVAKVPAVLMLHGFGDTPQTLSYLAAAVHERGWSVRVPLLPGHGRRLEEWARTGKAEWLDAARVALAALRETHDVVAVVGLSMGAALAVHLAAEEQPASIGSLVLLASYLGMPPWIRALARWHRLIGLGMPYVRGSQRPSILDPTERDRNLAYGVATPRLVNELASLTASAWYLLPRITAPTLMMHSHRDNRVSAAVAEQAFARLTVTDKQLVWIDAGHHIITVDYGRESVAERVGDWLDVHKTVNSES